MRAEPEDIPLDIVYEDSHVLVVNKPAHMVSINVFFFSFFLLYSSENACFVVKSRFCLIVLVVLLREIITEKLYFTCYISMASEKKFLCIMYAFSRCKMFTLDLRASCL